MPEELLLIEDILDMRGGADVGLKRNSSVRDHLQFVTWNIRDHLHFVTQNIGDPLHFVTQNILDNVHFVTQIMRHY